MHIWTLSFFVTIWCHIWTSYLFIWYMLSMVPKSYQAGSSTTTPPSSPKNYPWNGKEGHPKIACSQPWRPVPNAVWTKLSQVFSSIWSWRPWTLVGAYQRWWASSSDTLIYPSIFAFPSLSLHCRSTTTHLCSNATARQSHSLHRTDLTYLIDIWLTIHMYLLLFLVSPTCPLLQSDQSWVLALHGQALFL